jgi:hypothetical protein
LLWWVMGFPSLCCYLIDNIAHCLSYFLIFQFVA